MPRFFVNVDVPNLERAVAFYTAAFGLRVGRNFGDYAVELVGAESPIYLLANDAGTAPFPGAGTSRNYERHWTPVHLDFVVDDLDEAVRRVEAAGGHRERGIDERDWGRIAVFRDPFGHGVCLVQFTGRGYDEIAT